MTKYIGPNSHAQSSMFTWQELIDAIGAEPQSEQFKNLLSKIPENPKIERSDPRHNLPGKPTHFFFCDSGMEFTFAFGVCEKALLQLISHKPDFTHHPYSGPLPPGISKSFGEAQIIELMGKPKNVSGGREMLGVGYIDKAFTYDDSSIETVFCFDRHSGTLSRIVLHLVRNL